MRKHLMDMVGLYDLNRVGDGWATPREGSLMGEVEVIVVYRIFLAKCWLMIKGKQKLFIEPWQVVMHKQLMVMVGFIRSELGRGWVGNSQRLESDG